MHVYCHCTVLFIKFFTADRPLVVQFASNNAKDFADAAELVTPYVNRFDLDQLDVIK